jgi:hypothetical protein
MYNLCILPVFNPIAAKSISTIEYIESIMATVSSIQIKPETKEALKKIGKMGDTYNDVIDQLIEEHFIHKSKLQLDGDIRQWKRNIKEHPERFVNIDEL